MTSLRDCDAFLFDVDGTLVLSDDPNAGGGAAHALGGAPDVLVTLRARGIRFACFTNGTGQLPSAIAAKLRSVGLDVHDDEVMTPATVAAEHIIQQYASEAVLAFGTEGLLQPLLQAGVKLAGFEKPETAKVVVIGADPDFNYEKLTAACRAVWAGAPMLVTSMAPYFASAGGRLPSTSGAIAAGIRHVTGAEPIVVGKPAPLVLQTAARHLGSQPSRLAVIGDDLRLEVRMAREAGACSVLVLSGTSHQSDVENVPTDQRPDFVLPVIGDLRSLLNK